MIKKILNKIDRFNEKPEIYTKGNSFMWNDKYISKQLLKVHLNEEVDLASRKQKTINKTISWIFKQIESEEKLSILDLGCGPGLYCREMARNGHYVHGIDISKNSIEYARSKKGNLNIDYELADYNAIELESEKYDLIIMIYCDFGVLSPREQKELLTKVKKALKVGGLFIFDVLNDSNIDKKKTDNIWSFAKKGFWDSKPYLELVNSFSYEDEKTLVNQHLIITESQTKLYRFWTQFFSDKKLKNLIEENGLIIKLLNKNLLPEKSIWDGKNVTFCAAQKK